MSTVNCPYVLGDTGPAGGIIISVPNSGHNNTNYYYEITSTDLHTSTSTSSTGSVMGTALSPPGPLYPEWGGWGQSSAPITWTEDFNFGHGHTNTADAMAHLGAGSGGLLGGNVSQLSNTTAIAMCSTYTITVGGVVYDDWFLPSAMEWQEVGLNADLHGLDISLLNLTTTPNGNYWTSNVDHSIINHLNVVGTTHPYVATNPYTAMAYNVITGYSAPGSGNPIAWRLVKNFDINVRAMRRFECPVPNTVPSCYQIGDPGPGGGIIFSTPGYTHSSGITNWTNFYWEVGPTDLVTSAAQYNSAGLTDCPADAGNNASVQWLNTAGAEFGGKDTQINTNFHDGSTNTALITALPSGGSTSPPNPVYDVNSIAAEECKNYTGFNYTDWYLPSFIELTVMIDECIGMSGNPANLTTSPGTLSGSTAITPWYQNEYWSSSELPGNATQAISMIATLPIQLRSTEKCHTRSVRPMRRFVCTPTPCTGINCVDYNYRDGWYTSPGALVSQSSCAWPMIYQQTQATGCTNNIGQHVTATYPPYNSATYTGNNLFYTNYPGDSTIGRPYLQFFVNHYDALGNHYVANDWSDDSIGYTITIWDRNYNFLGQWKYDTFEYYTQWASTATGDHTKYNIPTASYSIIYLKDVTHLAGSDPFLHYSGPGNGPGASTSHCYFKIECAATVGNTFAQASNATVWGNVASPSPWGVGEIPSKCIYHPLGQRVPGVLYTPPGPNQAGYYCFPWYAQVSLDSIVPGTMHPDRAICRNTNVPCGIPCCGSGISSSVRNSGGIEASGGEKNIKNFDRGKDDKELIGDCTAPTIIEGEED